MVKRSSNNLKPSIRHSHPVFFVGEARSGKTLLSNFFACHPDTFWFSNYTDMFPRFPFLAASIRLRGLPWIGPLMKTKMASGTIKGPWPKPAEGNNIYHVLCGLENKKWVTEDELTECQTTCLMHQVNSHAAYSGKHRFINDQSANTQRIRQIAALFPDAYFIHIIRDGRAVINELVQTKWWPTTHAWWLDDIPARHYTDKDGAVRLAAKNWHANVSCLMQQKPFLNKRYKEVRFEELIRRPHDVVAKVLEFCDLYPTENYFKTIPETISSNNEKWRTDLTDRQITVIDVETGDLLRNLGYV